MNKIFSQSITISFSIITLLFMFVSENIFRGYIIIPIFIICLFTFFIYRKCRNNINISKKNQYSIEVRYGDLFELNDGKVIIPFDECFTTEINDLPSGINQHSICGQYLKRYPIQNMCKLIDKVGLKPSTTVSQYQNKNRYESGRIVPNGQFLLMAFAKLDKDGLARMTRDEYLQCLFVLWIEIEKYYGQENIYMPILGSGVTRMEDKSLSQQELLDLIIESYQLTSHKIKLPNKLYIICRKKGDFSINKIVGNK